MTNAQEKFIEKQIRAGLSDRNIPENIMQMIINQYIGLYRRNEFNGKPSKLVQDAIKQGKSLKKKR